MATSVLDAGFFLRCFSQPTTTDVIRDVFGMPVAVAVVAFAGGFTPYLWLWDHLNPTIGVHPPKYKLFGQIPADGHTQFNLVDRRLLFFEGLSFAMTTNVNGTGNPPGGVGIGITAIPLET